MVVDFGVKVVVGLRVGGGVVVGVGVRVCFRARIKVWSESEFGWW